MNNYDIFISYAKADEVIVQNLLTGISESNYKGCFDSLISKELALVEKDTLLLSEQIRESKVIIFVLSKSTNKNVVLPSILANSISQNSDKAIVISLDDDFRKNVVWPLISDVREIPLAENKYKEILSIIELKLDNMVDEPVGHSYKEIVTEEMSDLLNIRGMHTLVSGLSNYGKTVCANYLEEEFVKNNYNVYKRTISEKDVNLDGSFSNIFGRPRSVSELIKKLLLSISTENSNGLVIILDLANISSHEVPIKLLNDFAAIVFSNKELSSKVSGDFRLYTMTSVMSGDAISDWPKPPYNNHVVLKEFTTDSIRIFWEKNTSHNIGLQDVSRVSFLSGGHPRLLEKILSFYKENRNLDFKNLDLKSLLNDEIKKMASSIDSRVFNFINTTNLFYYRCIDRDVINNLYGLEYTQDNLLAETMYSNLIRNKLYLKLSFDNELSKVSCSVLMRRVFLVYLCLDNLELFKRNCELSKNTYFSYLKSNHMGRNHSVKWLIEYWFSRLLLKLPIVLYGRNVYSIDFNFQDDILSGLKMVFSGLTNSEVEKTKLTIVKNIKNDWEFCMFVNYQPNVNSKNDLYLDNKIDDILAIVEAWN